jgi:hypothetical protein
MRQKLLHSNNSLQLPPNLVPQRAIERIQEGHGHSDAKSGEFHRREEGVKVEG